jgi:pullulanase
VLKNRLFVLLALLGLLVVPVYAQEIEQPTSVAIAGTIQSVLGCPGDWQPECENTFLTFDPDDNLWQASFELPAGDYEYKVALNGTWDENYGGMADPGGPNVVLSLAEDTTVKFVYDHTTHWVADSVNHVIASVPGSFQSEIGCPGDWAPDCLRSWLQDPDGDGVYSFTTSGLLAGAYEAKVAINESWTINYGADGSPGGANIPFAVNEDNQPVVVTYNTTDNMINISVGGETGPAVGNLFFARAHWVLEDTLTWAVSRIPGAEYRLYYSPDATLELTAEGITGGDYLELTADRAGLPEEVLAKFPHLADFTALKISEDDLAQVPEILRGQIAVQATYNQGVLQDATSVQIPGVLDDLYTFDGALGATFEDGVPTLSVWAPTAQNVALHLFDDANSETEATRVEMTRDDATGVWSVTGEADWYSQYYLYEVEVYTPYDRVMVTNLVTDPYSVSLSMNSQRSQIIDLNDPALMPEGWAALEKPELEAPEDIVLYELHMRDFSAYDQSVAEENRGRYTAFTETESAGMQHLQALAQAGLTHIHLLPSFDIATINENAAERQDADPAELAALPPDSTEQQAIVMSFNETDSFNWGYDPYHYSVPEGSYSTDPNGPQRILEFREMVQALNQAGLRVVTDVVYNHTNAAGQNDRSVLDKIVPGYYHRLNADGRVETSTCCQNTATEHNMMRKLMVDSVLLWATAYQVDGFRFDLMGHHMVDDMLAVREALNSLTIDEDGVNGEQIYVYGEGWNFGEVADNVRGVNATQLNLPGTGIGTFNDRIRDSVRGGSPFGGLQEQGFANGLYVDPNGITPGTDEEVLARALLFADRIRVALAGNLADYTFEGASGEMVTGAEVDYNGQPTGYTLDPQEQIAYTDAHDNETIFDLTQMKAPTDADLATRIRMNNMALSIVGFSQGVPFFHAGSDILRSKSVDRDSYNSGDWFNQVDWSYETSSWGIGLPVQDKNEDRWEIVAPLLADPALRPSSEQTTGAAESFREILQIRRSSPLFRLRTAEDVMARVQFHNTGADQIPGVIVMSLSDMEGDNLDPNHQAIVVVFNATPEEQALEIPELADWALELHPVQAASSDPVVQTSTAEAGTLTVPAYTTAVFVVNE